jgi:hypothetical protein
VTLGLKELLERDDVRLRGVVKRLPLRLEDEAGRECVSVLALLAVWAFPEPAEPTGYENKKEEDET